MRYFLDTEFIEDGKTIDLISIGIVSEDGREFYVGNKECDFSRASDWVIDNVLIPMGFSRMPKQPWSEGFMKPIDPGFWLSKEEIKVNLLNFFCWRPNGFVPFDSYSQKNINNYESLTPEFWGYYADYDHVAFCQLFGTMMDLPNGFPMYCRDLKQWCDDLGNPRLPEQTNGEHNTLEDAKWNKKVYDFLLNYKTQ
jgi:hypothetical protein